MKKFYFIKLLTLEINKKNIEQKFRNTVGYKFIQYITEVHTYTLSNRRSLYDTFQLYNTRNLSNASIFYYNYDQ